MIDKVASKRCQSGVKGTNWAFSLVFHYISSSFFLFWVLQMMLMVTGKRPSFDILPHKKDTASKQGKIGSGHNLAQVEIAQMGLPEL